jgi:hypothetical protein
MPDLEPPSPSAPPPLERHGRHVAVYDRPPPPRAPWLTPVVVPAMVVLLVATLLIYLFAAQ